MLRLSKRLQAVASLAGACVTLADVGTDHGYIPVYLVGCERAKRAIALDVNPGPLQRAREHIRQYGMEGQIEARLSDGLSALAPGEADQIVIAGMGGGLMMRILAEGREAAGAARRLVLQPQSEVAAFRGFLWEDGYQIEAEDMVYEDGKYYPMMAVRAGFQDKRRGGHGPAISADGGEGGCIQEGAMPGQEGIMPGQEGAMPGQEGIMPGQEGAMLGQEERLRQKFGPLLLEGRHPVLKEYLLRQQGQKERILGQLRQQARGEIGGRIAELEEDLRDIEKGLGYYG